jgi:hypothetical protein
VIVEKDAEGISVGSNCIQSGWGFGSLLFFPEKTTSRSMSSIVHLHRPNHRAPYRLVVAHRPPHHPPRQRQNLLLI